MSLHHGFDPVNVSRSLMYLTMYLISLNRPVRSRSSGSRAIIRSTIFSKRVGLGPEMIGRKRPLANCADC